MKGVTNVSLVYPLIYDWELIRLYTDNLIYAFKQSNLESIVFNTSLPLPPEKTGFLAADIKLEIFEKFKTEGFPLITIMPSFYLDNLTAPWALPAIINEGLISYPLPGDAEFVWLSHFNLAQYTYSALLKADLIGSVYPIGGELISGNEIGAKISKELNGKVEYKYLKPEDFKLFLRQTRRKGVWVNSNKFFYIPIGMYICHHGA
jgi:NAD(P)H dehydrogenase (quinone)